MRLRTLCSDFKCSDFKRPLGILATIAALSSLAGAQSVRGLGLGGALVPGPSLGAFNPAFAAYPSDGRGGGLVLPLGLLNFLLNPQLNVIDFAFNTGQYSDPGNPNAPEFNALAAFDQVTHLNTLILNPVAAPREINVGVSATGITLTDQNGQPLGYTFQSGTSSYVASAYSAAGATPLLRIPFSVGPVNFGIGAFVGVRGPSLGIDAELQRDLAAGGGRLPPNRDYPQAVTGSVGAVGGFTIDVGYAAPIVVPGATLYVGGRATGFYGLFNAEVSVIGALKSGSDGNLTNSTPSYSLRNFSSGPGIGFGYGANVDVGVVADLPSSTVGWQPLEQLTLGLGIVGVIDFYNWTGQERVTLSDGSSTLSAATRGSAAFDPLVTLNAAGRFSLSNGLRVLGLFDVQFGRGQFSAHLGAESIIGPVTVRGGLGIENGLRFGLGASIDLASSFGLDVALTTHQAPFYNHTNFGIALAVRFGF